MKVLKAFLAVGLCNAVRVARQGSDVNRAKAGQHAIAQRGDIGSTAAILKEFRSQHYDARHQPSDERVKDDFMCQRFFEIVRHTYFQSGLYDKYWSVLKNVDAYGMKHRVQYVNPDGRGAIGGWGDVEYRRPEALDPLRFDNQIVTYTYDSGKYANGVVRGRLRKQLQIEKAASIAIKIFKLFAKICNLSL